MDAASPCDLKGLGVMVTRPAGQAESLCRAIEAAKGRPIRFPALKIVAAVDDDTISLLGSASTCDWLIFISTNAVQHALPYLGRSAKTGIAAVGRATADALEDAGFDSVLVPDAGADSEALLAEPAMQQVAGQRIVIVRGQGGRPLLGDSLAARGARVRYAEVYRRELPAIDDESVSSIEQQNPEVLVATSGEILENLVTLLGRGNPLLKRPLVVVSSRVAAMAEDLGFRPVLRSEGAGNRAIIDTLCDLVVHR